MIVEAATIVITSSTCSLLKPAAVKCSMLGPDHEQLAADGDGFRGVQSGKRYTLDA